MRKISSIFCILLSIYSGTNAVIQNGRVIGGSTANENYDFVVRIISVLTDISPSGYLSSGVAITAHHVVTVGQAIFGYTAWHVYHGSINVDQQIQATSSVAALHPQYNGGLLHNNIGVIHVTDSIGRFLPIAPGPPNWVFGYGITHRENQQLANTLQQGSVMQLTLDTCLQIWNQFVIRPDNMCTISINQFVGNGDQGGPATNQAVTGVTGILSFWDVAGMPMVFVNLNDHIGFIDGQISR